MDKEQSWVFHLLNIMIELIHYQTYWINRYWTNRAGPDTQNQSVILQLITNNDPHRYMRTGNISIPQLLTTLLAISAKSREQTPLTKMVKLMTQLWRISLNLTNTSVLAILVTILPTTMLMTWKTRWSVIVVFNNYYLLFQNRQEWRTRLLVKNEETLFCSYSWINFSLNIWCWRGPLTLTNAGDKVFRARDGGRGSHIIDSSNPTLTAPRLLKMRAPAFFISSIRAPARQLKLRSQFRRI